MDLHDNEYQGTWSVISSFVPTRQTQRILSMKTHITARIARVAEPRPRTHNNKKVGHLDSKDKKIHSILAIEFRI
jgi:hypothetical protein